MFKSLNKILLYYFLFLSSLKFFFLSSFFYQNEKWVKNLLILQKNSTIKWREKKLTVFLFFLLGREKCTVRPRHERFLAFYVELQKEKENEEKVHARPRFFASNREEKESIVLIQGGVKKFSSLYVRSIYIVFRLDMLFRYRCSKVGERKKGYVQESSASHIYSISIRFHSFSHPSTRNCVGKSSFFFSLEWRQVLLIASCFSFSPKARILKSE